MIKGLDNAINAIDGMVADSNETIKKEYIKTLTAIVKQTPVHFKDGGRLRNSWTLSSSAPKGAQRRPSRSGGSSLSSIARMPKNVLGKRLFFTNAMSYANVVEYGGYPKPPKQGTNTAKKGKPPTYQMLSNGSGYSRQAPFGMVRISVRKARVRIKKANKK